MRFVHFAPQSRISSIRRSGLRGARIYCMPVTCDFWISHQWVGEMGRVHQEKMVAVYFVVPDQSPVEVGYFGHPTELTQAGATVEWISQLPSDPQPHPQLHPNNKLGVQVVLLGAVPRQNIYRIASINNLVGWRESPQGRSDCLCPVCLPAGSPNRIGQLRAAVRRLLRCWGQAESGAEMAGVLWELAEAVSAGRGRISLAQPSVRSKSSRHRQIGRSGGTRPELPQRLVQRALAHGDSRVRTALADLVSHLSWPQAREVLQILLEDDCELVWQAAVMAVHRILGDQGALVHLSQAAGDPRFTAFLLSVLADD